MTKTIFHTVGLYWIVSVSLLAGLVGCRIDKYKPLAAPRIFASVDPDIRFLIMGESKYQIVSSDGVWSKGRLNSAMDESLLDLAFPVYKKYQGKPIDYDAGERQRMPPAGIFAFDPLRQMTGILVFPEFPDEVTVNLRGAEQYPPIRFVNEKNEYDLVNPLRDDYWLGWPVFAFDATRIALYGVSLTSAAREYDQIILLDRLSGKTLSHRSVAGCGSDMFSRYVSDTVIRKYVQIGELIQTHILPDDSNIVVLSEQGSAITEVTLVRDEIRCTKVEGVRSAPNFSEGTPNTVYQNRVLYGIVVDRENFPGAGGEYQFSADGMFALEWGHSPNRVFLHSFVTNVTDLEMQQIRSEDVTDKLDIYD